MSQLLSLLPLYRDILYFFAIFVLSFRNLQCLPISELHSGNRIHSQCLNSVYQ